MFGKILIANRGEIALRIIRTCREMGIRSVIAHSTVDANSLPVRLADESICIGPEDSAQSYLNIPRLIAAAEVTDAEAVHPGYGFLAENATFAEICRACNIRFIGPSPEVIRLLGDKVRARELARKADVPLLPGSEGAVRDEAEARTAAEALGYPVLLKASMGGGGRGIRVVWDAAALGTMVRTCQSEAAAAFGSSEIYVEKYVEGARHVEVQILGDAHGHTIHLGERDCSIQRRHQKLIEEAPCPRMTDEVRQGLTAAALRLCREVSYESAGTVEFLLDREGRFYFLEVNTRIQVEHPVTEMVTGVDLVREQIRVAARESLHLRQEDVVLRGHAIECRVTAEDPVTFAPSPGRVTAYLPAGGPGVRVDSHCFAGYTVPAHYDSLLAKVITHGANREEALARMRRALGEFIVEGVKTTLPLHARLMMDPRFISGDYSTTFLEVRALTVVHGPSVPGALTRRAALLAALAAIAPTTIAAQPPGRSTLRLAVQGPRSGRRADAGESMSLGAQLAVEQLRAGIERAGYGIELVSFDDQERPDVGVANAKLILASPDILAVVGHLSAGVAVPASEIYKDAHLALVSPAASGTLLTDRGLPGVNRVCGRHDVQGAVAAEFAGAVLKVRSVYVLHDRTTPGQDVAEFFRAEAERRGLRVLGMDGTDERVDVDRVVGTIVGTGPDLVYFGGGHERAASILRRVREQGSKAHFLGSDALDSPDLARAAGRAALGLHYTATTGPVTAWPRPRPFVEEFRQRFGRDPGAYAAEAYDAAAIALRAIEGVVKGGAPGREAVAAAIRRVRHPGVTGDIEFDGKGDRRRATYFVFQVVADDPERWSDNRLVRQFPAAPPGRS